MSSNAAVDDGKGPEKGTDLGNLSRLPAEVRIAIYKHLFGPTSSSVNNPHWPSPATPRSWTRRQISSNSVPTGSNPGHSLYSARCVAIMRVNRAFYAEVSETLYSNPQSLIVYPYRPLRTTWGTEIPQSSALLLSSITLMLQYYTLNRGDAETAFDKPTPFNVMCSTTEALCLMLRQSHRLKLLRIELNNHSVRKRGSTLIRTTEMRAQMKRVLEPFAYLQEAVEVYVTGFESTEWGNLFSDLRAASKGHPLPLNRWTSEALTD